MSEAATDLPQLLCVDDDPAILAAVHRLLKNDFKILQANSGEEALSLLESHSGIAIVLTDQRMSGISGLDLLTKVQELSPDTVRVVFSGHISLTEMADAINESRIHRFIYKPWDNEYLRVQMLESLATYLTLKERRLLEAMSVTDALTQTKNRRYLQDRLQAEIERSQRHSRPLSLVMIDIDHFKNVNDEYGHPAGDRILLGVAQLLQTQLRSIDTIARYGGEEFALLLPDTNRDDAVLVAERIRQKVKVNFFELEGGPRIQVTISLGVACHPTDAATTEDLIARADACLYQAKGQGRDQTVGAV